MIFRIATLYRIIFLIVVLSFVHGSCLGQKIIQKEFDAENIQSLSIEDDALFKITLISSETGKIQMKLHVSGEHSESIVVEEKLINGTLFLSTGFTPFFVLENDKLAAHKVMALQMEIFVPRHISVLIKSKLASVLASGIFENLAIALEYGSCILKEFSGNAHLKGVNGDITVVAEQNVSGHAVSKSGTVVIKLPKDQLYTIFAESINGNISMEQTK